MNIVYDLENYEEISCFLDKMEKINATSMRFNENNKTVEYMIGGGKVIKVDSIADLNEKVLDIFSFLGNFKHDISNPLIVVKFDSSYVVSVINDITFLDKGFDDIHLKLVNAGTTRANGLSIVSSNKFSTIPYTLRNLYKNTKKTKPNLSIKYITSNDFINLNECFDMLFIESQDTLEKVGNQIEDIVLSGIPVVLGVVAGNSMFALQKVSKYISFDVLGSFSFLNTLIHQKSIPVLCKSCALSFDEFVESGQQCSQELIYRLTRIDIEKEDSLRFNGKGCDHCCNGLTSETLCVDIILPDYDMLDLVQKGELSNAWRSWRQYHLDGAVGKRFEDHAFDKMKDGLISPTIVEEYFEMLNIQLLLEDGMLTSDEVESLNAPIYSGE